MSASSSAPLRGAPKPFLHKASGQAAVKVRGRFYYLGKHGSPAAREEYLRIIREVWSKPPAEAPAGLTLRQLDRLSVLDLLAGFWEHADRYYVKDGKPRTTIAAIAPPPRRPAAAPAARAVRRATRGRVRPAEAEGPAANVDR